MLTIDNDSSYTTKEIHQLNEMC